MRLYTLSKRHFVLVFVVFFVCFGLTVFVGIKGRCSFGHGILYSHPVQPARCTRPLPPGKARFPLTHRVEGRPCPARTQPGPEGGVQPWWP